MFFTAAKKQKLAQKKTTDAIECQKCEIKRRLQLMSEANQRLQDVVTETRDASVDVVKKLETTSFAATKH